MKPSQRSRIALEENKGLCYSICTPGQLCVTAITDPEYPERVAFALLYDLAADFVKTFQSNPAVASAKQDISLPYKGIEELLAKGQKPEESTVSSLCVDDRLLYIERELDTVTVLMKKNVQDMLIKGEQLDELMKKSKDLSSVSVTFYEKAKKNNQCCSLL